MHHGIGQMVGYPQDILGRVPSGKGQVQYPFVHQTWGPTLLLVTSGGDHWRPVQTFSGRIPTQGVTSGSGH